MVKDVRRVDWDGGLGRALYISPDSCGLYFLSNNVKTSGSKSHNLLAVKMQQYKWIPGDHLQALPLIHLAKTMFLL